MPNLSESKRRAIANDILLCTRGGSLENLCYGTFSELAPKYQCNQRTIARVWKRFKASVAAGNMAGDVSSRIKTNSGRKGYDKLELATAIKAVPIEERRTISTTAKAVGVSTGVLQRLLRDCIVKRASSRIKPLLTPQNKRERMEYALAFVDESTYFFEPMYDVVHVDEKWFYEDEDKHTYYVVGDEEVPQRHRRSKRFIQKTMFLAAVAKPRYDPHRKCRFDGKIGIWSFTEDTIAARGSVNRPKGAPVTKNIESVTQKVYKDYIINKVIPAIKAVWPRGEKKKIIFIQQDNARPHLSPSDADVVAAGREGGWNIRLLCQPPNSPDFNVLDLGFFASIQSLQLRKGARGIQMLMKSVKQAYVEIEADTLEDVFLSLQACMTCSLECNGGNEYKLPHMSKTKLRRQDNYPAALSVGKELYERVASETNWLF